jgi:hypothetical protein
MNELQTANFTELHFGRWERLRSPALCEVCGRQSRQQCRRLVVLFQMNGERQPT